MIDQRFAPGLLPEAEIDQGQLEPGNCCWGASSSSIGETEMSL